MRLQKKNYFRWSSFSVSLYLHVFFFIVYLDIKNEPYL